MNTEKSDSFGRVGMSSVGCLGVSNGFTRFGDAYQGAKTNNPESDMVQQLDEAHHALARLLERADALHVALTPILRPAQENGERASKMPEANPPALAPLCESVRAIGGSIDSVVLRLEEILGRLAI